MAVMQSLCYVNCRAKPAVRSISALSVADHRGAGHALAPHWQPVFEVREAGTSDSCSLPRNAMRGCLPGTGLSQQRLPLTQQLQVEKK